jgi:hypothetical protein
MVVVEQRMKSVIDQQKVIELFDFVFILKLYLQLLLLLILLVIQNT